MKVGKRHSRLTEQGVEALVRRKNMSTGRHGLLDTILTISMFFIEDPGPDLPPAGQADVDQVQSLLRDLHKALISLLTVSARQNEQPRPPLPRTAARSPAPPLRQGGTQCAPLHTLPAGRTRAQATRGTSQEAKAWLINAIAALGVRDPGLRRRKFAQFLPGGSAYDRDAHAEFAAQLLQGLFADEPQKVCRDHVQACELVRGSGVPLFCCAGGHSQRRASSRAAVRPPQPPRAMGRIEVPFLPPKASGPAFEALLRSVPLHAPGGPAVSGRAGGAAALLPL